MGETMKRVPYKHLKAIGMGIAGLGITLFLFVVAIERKFSARISYKDIDHLTSERQRLIKDHHAQEIVLDTQDGEKIAGLLIERPEATRIFIMCHGYKSCKERLSDFVDMFPHDTLLFVDLRGHGQSSGSRASLGLNEYHDCLAAFNHARTSVSTTLPIFGLGISLGGSALLRAAAAGAQFDGIIADSSPTEFRNMISGLLWRRHKVPPALARLALCWYETVMGCSLLGGNCTMYAKNITSPVLILHDQNDTVVEYNHALTLHESLGSVCKQLITVTGTYHGKLRHNTQQYKAYVEQFIEACYTNKNT